jgi:hypothetical protein
VRAAPSLPPRAIGLLFRFVRNNWPLVAGKAADYFEEHGAGAVSVRWSELERWACSPDPVEVRLSYASPPADGGRFHRAVASYDPTCEVVAFVGVDELFDDLTLSRLPTLPTETRGYGWYGVFGGPRPPRECVPSVRARSG